MTSADDTNWNAVNQRYLMAAVAAVRQALERHAARSQGKPESDQQDKQLQDALAESARDMPAPPALETLCRTFSLSPFERDVLLLCAAMELDSSFGSLCATAQGDASQAYPTFTLALAALPQAHWSALTQASPLRRWRLIEVTAGDNLTTSRLRIDESVLHYLAGVPHLDDHLRGLVEVVHAPGELPASQRRLAERIQALWSPTTERSTWPAVMLCADDHSGKRAVAAAACARLGLRLHAIRAGDLPHAGTEREALACLWEREAFLKRSALLVDFGDAASSEVNPAMVAFLQRVEGLLAVAVREPLWNLQRPLVRVDVRKPPPAEQQELWLRALGPLAAGLNGRLEIVSRQFSLSLDAIQAIHTELRRDSPDEQDLGSRLWDLCRAQARPRLDDLAQRIEPLATWEDLVLPKRQHRTLKEIAIHMRQRTKVYESWGFAAKVSRGLGISALFEGPSGTGKTMAAEVLANELSLDLYRIDLSQVVSKYIGETEKNLRRVFDVAEDGGAILLFDEADALFGKRSEVKDSHDRYANIEVSYLLQRMEAYRGLAILTTNRREALDTAFLRRIRFIVQFPFPAAEHRAEIWRGVFPAPTPVEELNPARLAQLNVAGGNIRNIALNAAFLAAEAGERVRMAHLLRAARSEYSKLEKMLTESEIAGWS